MGAVQPIDLDLVQAAVVDALGGAVAGVERISGSITNQDFVVDRGHHPRVVLKSGPRAEVAAEAWTCERLLERGVPVPRVLAADLDGGALGAPHLVMAFVDGEPTLDDAVVREAGAQLRRVHEVHLQGWGPLEVAGSSARGRHDSWAAAVDAALDGLDELVRAELLDQGQAEAVRSAAQAVRGYDGPAALLHHDLKRAHLFGVAGSGASRRLAAVIDWGDATAGDPAADLARLSMAGPAATAAFLDGYGLPLTDHLADRLARYRLVWNTRSLTGELRAGGDWFDAYRTGITDDLRRLACTTPPAS